jgi:hypothetical protein
VLHRESESKAMRQPSNRPGSDEANRLVSTSLHTRVYAVLIGLLLPIATAAIGMMAFGIEFQIVERAAGF